MIKIIASAAIAATTWCAALSAATLDFNFSFDNAANGGGTVTGIVRGLEDNGASAATSVEVLSNTAGFGIGEYVGATGGNRWWVVNGAITDVDFLFFGSFADPASPLACCTLAFRKSSGQLVAGLKNDPGSVTTLSPGSAVTLTAVTQPPAVPLPAGGVLLVTAIAGFAGLRRVQRQSL